MPSLSEIYNEAILSEKLLESLQAGSVPNVDELIAELEAYKVQHPEFGEKPLFVLEDNTVDQYEASSASKINSSLDRFQKDSDVTWEVFRDITRRAVLNSRKWNTMYEHYRKILTTLEGRIDTLLLMNDETLGYYDYVSDDFKSLEFVDLEASDVQIDTSTGSVTIGEVSVDGGTYERLDTSYIVPRDIVVSTVTAESFVSSSTFAGCDPINALKESYSPWLQSVAVRKNSPVSFSYKVDLGSDKTLNRIKIKLGGSTSSSSYIVTPFFSLDGNSFSVVPAVNFTQSGSDTLTWTFPEVDIRHLRFLMQKNGPDSIDADSNYVFEFGLKQISLYMTGFDTERGNLLVTTTRTLVDIDGATKAFQKIALSVCEDVPDETNIGYYVSVDSGVTYLAIAPLERTTSSLPYVIDFSSAVSLENEDSSAVFDGTRTSVQLDVDQLNTSYTITGATDVLLNWYLDTEASSALDVANVQVFRNTTSSSLVRGVPAGWSLSGGFYSCYLFIDSASGLVVDFGSTRAFLDEVEISGVVTIRQGLHTFRTSVANWQDVVGGYGSLSSLKAADALYPYNHKLLVQGYDYSSSFTEEQLYRGVDSLFSVLGSYVTLHDFNTRVSNNLDIWTLDVDDSDRTVLLLKTDRSLDDWVNETVLVRYKLFDRHFTDIILKAVFSTENSALTPTLKSYVIKLG